MPQDRRDGGKRHAGGHGRDPVPVAQAFRTGLLPVDRGLGHQPGDLAVCSGPGERPQAQVPAPLAAARAQFVHELKHSQELAWHRHLAPSVGPPLQRADPHGARLKIDVAGPDCEHLGNASTSMSECQRKSLICRRRAPGSLEETGPLLCGEVLAAAAVNQRRDRLPGMCAG